MDTVPETLNPETCLVAALREAKASPAVVRAATQRWRAWLVACRGVMDLRARNIGFGIPSRLPEPPEMDVAAARVVAGAQAAERAGRLERPCVTWGLWE
jgi:hypothetical protein